MFSFVHGEYSFVAAGGAAVFYCRTVSGYRVTFYTGVGKEYPLISSMALADDVPIPIGNEHHQITCAVGHALAA